MFNLSGNNILVSGGAGKIGSAIVFAITEVGGVPIIADVNKKSLNKISSELKGGMFPSHGTHFLVAKSLI